MGFAGWDSAFDDVGFSLSDIEAYEQGFPELLPSRLSSSKPEVKKQRKQFPESQRYYWRCRAVAQVLYHKDGSLSAEKIAESAEIAMFGCESRIDVYGLDLVAKWVADVCGDSMRVGENDNLSESDKPLFEEKPKMRPEERHYERTRAVAAFLWSKNPNMTIADMIVQDRLTA